ncbi:hypothetical protein DKX38_029305 [Salix brachista]|uniref:Uncharacterized protein n=1 Tax=Salix brachista TaxID=2182728 RepID=A0A5N5JB31_9ROSI|nr:hypothetical protein DKX38_029305 [Salix brachista]
MGNHGTIKRWPVGLIGMLAGWNGPAASMNEDAIYVVNELTGALSEYDCKNDSWKKVIELPELKLAEQIAAGRGRVCVVYVNGETVVVVDVTARPARMKPVEKPNFIRNCDHLNAPCNLVVPPVRLVPVQ